MKLKRVNQEYATVVGLELSAILLMLEGRQLNTKGRKMSERKTEMLIPSFSSHPFVLLFLISNLCTQKKQYTIFSRQA